MTAKSNPAVEPPALTRDPKLNIAQRLNMVMGLIGYIQKEKKEGMKYTIVSHDAVTDLVRDHFAEIGILYYPCNIEMKQDGNRTEAVITIRFENIDDRSDYIEVVSMGYGVDTQDKGPGKAISYAVKYALLKVLGLVTGDDPDLEQGDGAKHRSNLDARVESLELAISTSKDSTILRALMEAAPTVEIMAALQTRQPGEFQRVRAVMASKSRELKEREAADQRPEAERG